MGKNKDFNQHFLVDAAVRAKLLQEAKLSDKDIVVEIGPGKGVLSEESARRVKSLICIEIDKALKPYLDSLQRFHTNIHVVYGNVLNTEIPPCTKIISNLPFSIVEPFMSKLVHCDFDEAFLIVGNRFANAATTLQESRLSLLTNCFFQCEKKMEIKPYAFEPKPRVLSALIHLKKKGIEEIDDDRLLLFRLMFAFEKSKVRNALLEALIKLYSLKRLLLTKREAKHLVSQFGISDEILEKQFNLCTNKDLKMLIEALSQ